MELGKTEGALCSPPLHVQKIIILFWNSGDLQNDDGVTPECPQQTNTSFRPLITATLQELSDDRRPVFACEEVNQLGLTDGDAVLLLQLVRESALFALRQ